MRRLMLLRHAKTEHDAPSGHDQDRRLDARGQLDAAAIGDWIGRHPPVPDAVLVSTAVRAQQTWEIAREAMIKAIGDHGPQPRVELLPELYGAEPTQLLQIIRMAEVGDPARLMVIGHNPGMHELALMLAGSSEPSAKKAIEDNLPTGGLAIIDFAVAGWGEVAFRGGNLVRFTSPKLLKQTSDD
jgi:phosphohistidine phosphatase